MIVWLSDFEHFSSFGSVLFFSEVFQAGKHLTLQNDRKFYADSKYAHIEAFFGDLGLIFLRQSATFVI